MSGVMICMEIMMNSNTHSGNRRFRVVRGGYWNNAARICRSANRGVYYPSSSYGFIGFRAVKTISTDTNKNPVSASSESYRVRRGGYWNYDARDCRSANRFKAYPYYSFFNVGFRAVKKCNKTTENVSLNKHAVWWQR